MKTFFDHFIEHHWEKRPGVLPSPLQISLATDAELIDAALKAYADPRARAVPALQTQSDRPAYDEVEARSLMARHAKAPTLTEFVDGVICEGGLEGFFSYVSNLQIYKPEIWLRIQPVLGEITRRVGLPANRVDLDLFFGRYRQTPSGIHKDSASFCFVTHGRKRILVWPYETFAHLLEVQDADARHSTSFFLKDAANLDEWRSKAIVLEASPGEVIYWPSHYWHIGEDTGSTSSMVTLAFFLPEGIQRVLQKNFSVNYPRIRSRHSPWTFRTGYDSKTRSFTGIDQPATAAQALHDEIQSLLPETLSQFTRTWSLKASMGGFDVPPCLADVSESALRHSQWKWTGHHRIALYPGQAGLEMHAHGYAIAVTEGQKDFIGATLDLLHGGASVSIEALSHGPDGEAGALSLIRFLANSHSIERVLP